MAATLNCSATATLVTNVVKITSLLLNSYNLIFLAPPASKIKWRSLFEWIVPGSQANSCFSWKSFHVFVCFGLGLSWAFRSVCYNPIQKEKKKTISTRYFKCSWEGRSSANLLGSVSRCLFVIIVRWSPRIICCDLQVMIFYSHYVPLMSYEFDNIACSSQGPMLYGYHSTQFKTMGSTNLFVSSSVANLIIK